MLAGGGPPAEGALILANTDSRIADPVARAKVSEISHSCSAANATCAVAETSDNEVSKGMLRCRI